MYVLRSKATGVVVGWNRVIWKSGGVELHEVEGKTPQSILDEIFEVTGLRVEDSNPNPPGKKSRKAAKPKPIIEVQDLDLSGLELDATNNS